MFSTFFRIERKPVGLDWNLIRKCLSFWAREYVNKRLSIDIDVECGCKKNDIEH